MIYTIRKHAHIKIGIKKAQKDDYFNCGSMVHGKGGAVKSLEEFDTIPLNREYK